MENTVIDSLIARTKDLICPSGLKVTIREQNGDDDEVLSDVSAAKEGMSINNFIAAIITKSSLKAGRLTPEDILAMRLRDKYYILIASRIFSLGNIFTFDYTWDEEEKPFGYEEDLLRYFWDFHKPFPTPEDKEYSPLLIPPYPINEPEHIQTLSSGKVIRWDYSDGFAEKFLFELPLNERNRNAELKARRLGLRAPDGTFTIVQKFTAFSPKDMSEIRTEMDKLDSSPDLTTDITHPKTKEKLNIPLITNQDFFFPRVI